MARQDIRRHHRFPYLGPVRISWEGARGEIKHGHVKCCDVSQGGLKAEVPEAIPPRTTVWLRAERIQFSGAATVKHVTRVGAKYILGLELSQPIRHEAVAGAPARMPAGIA